ncbi:NAD-dependent epimerase/dehydratase family protein [Thiovibrio sp. JS02]
MRRVVVVGGTGFVGRAVVRLLVAQGIETSVLARNFSPELEALGVRQLNGDILDADFLNSAFAGHDTVIHLAAKTGIWGNKKEFQAVNIDGSRNCIAACRENKIPVLVFASTPGVVYQKGDLCGVNERTPYARNHLSHYVRSKALAEQAILAANSETLRTVVLRLHPVWGPGDTDLIPRLLGQARCRQLTRVGNGHNLVDVTYIDNAADALVLAARNLHGPATAAGKPYFISQGEPVNLWNWLNKFFRRLDIPVVESSISFARAYLLGMLSEAFHSCFRLKREPCMTRFLAVQLAKSHWFSIENASRDLGYAPRVTTAEGINNVLHWIKNSDF